jgi:hypothetical protein
VHGSPAPAKVAAIDVDAARRVDTAVQTERSEACVGETLVP